MRKLVISTLILASFILLAPTVPMPIVGGQIPGYPSYWEEHDWVLTPNEDRTVFVEVTTTIHPGDKEMKESTLSFFGKPSHFNARDYQTGAKLRIAVAIDTSAPPRTAVTIDFSGPQKDGYKFVLDSSHSNLVEKVSDPETYRLQFGWGTARGYPHTDRVTVKLPANYRFLNPPPAWKTSVEDGRQIVRFAGPPKSTERFGWSMIYERAAPSVSSLTTTGAHSTPQPMAQTFLGDLEANHITGAAGGVLGSLAAALGYLFKTKKKRLMKGYLKRIDSTFKESATDTKECKKRLGSMKEEIDSLFHKDKIEELQYDILSKRIDGYLHRL